jgi:hypothetical protein
LAFEADRGRERDGRWVAVQRVLLGLDRAAGAFVRPAGEALHHEASNAGLARGRQQDVGALGPQAVRELESSSIVRISVLPSTAVSS